MADELGQCYVEAARWQRDNPDWILCHGTCLGIGPIAGIWFGHAWCERDGIARDCELGLELPALLFRSVGNATDVIEYTHIEAVERMLRFEHYGPWED